MKKFTQVILLLLIIAASFRAGSWYTQRPSARSSADGVRGILYYQDPMHPAYRSDKPGLAPDCGMPLVPVYADGVEISLQDAGASLRTDVVQITPGQQRLIGVKTEEVVRGSAFDSIRVSGRVALDETRVFRIAASVDGWVRNSGPIVAGSIVQKDEVLSTFYNRDFLTAQQTYLYALNTMERNKTEGDEQLKLTHAQIQSAEENLEFLGMGTTQLREVARTHEIAKDIEFRAPVAGLVLARNAYPGLRFERGAELYRIADLSHVWVLANVSESEVPHFRPEAGARVVLPQVGRVIRAKVSAALPEYDANSGIFKVRLEVDNPGYALRPDMPVAVELPVRLSDTITVPADAVLDSGMKKRVYVDRGDGNFEPREIQTGSSFGDRIVITKGLTPRDRVVVSGTFLVDSESQLQGITGFYRAPTQDPVAMRAGENSVRLHQ
jgi:membrane fusion protein, copper/silver efflux system